MSDIGHNRGPAMDHGIAWRRHCWKKARADLLPHLPIEILRTRVRRAAELGLPYKTYASVRAASGHDVVAFLFSSNALRAFKNHPELAADRAQKLAALRNCGGIALVTKPLTPQTMRAANPHTRLIFAEAPDGLASWPDCARAITLTLRAQNLPRDGVVLIGDTTLERDWSTAGRLAGYLSAEKYFVAPDS
ncbi:MAG: hypothetical protein ACC646_12585 [Paracoccaceae bacterium]